MSSPYNSGNPSGGSSVNFGDTSTADSIVSSARSEKDDYHFGEDRAIGSPPNWPAYSSRELYDGAVNNNDPGTAEELGAQWNGQGQDLLTAADTLYEAITELSGAWVGQGSGAAQGSLIGVANASSTAGDAARAMGKRMQDQAAAAAEVKKMPPPKEFNVDRALAAGLAGGPAALAADMKAQADEARAVQDEQQRYMNAYTKSMTDVDSATPSFGPESIGFKPVAGTSYSGGTSGGPANVSVGDAGPTVSGIGGTVGNLTDGNYGLGNLAVTGSPSTGGVSPLVGDVQHAALPEPLSASGTAQVSTQGSGPGAGAALGTAALGAGLGFAGAKAFGKLGEQGRKNDKDERSQEEPEAVAGEDAGEQPESVETAETAETAEVRGHAAAAPGASGQPAQQPVTGAPQFGQPVAYGHPAPQGAPMSMPAAPAFSAPEQAQVPMSAPLAEGATSGVGDPSAVAPDHSATASAANEQRAPISPAAQQAQAFQHQQAQAAGAMAPGMHPMSGGAAGMGGMAGAGGGDAGGGANAQADQPSASYLIQPDPDDVFGPTEAVTSGVIGEDLEDD